MMRVNNGKSDVAPALAPVKDSIKQIDKLRTRQFFVEYAALQSHLLKLARLCR